MKPYTRLIFALGLALSASFTPPPGIAAEPRPEARTADSNLAAFWIRRGAHP